MKSTVVLLSLLGFCFGHRSFSSKAYWSHLRHAPSAFVRHSELSPYRHQRSPQMTRALAGYIKPDECGPRDDFAASNKGRVCQRKCDSDTDCVNERKLCLCDGVCGLSCIRPEKECPELPDPPHGQVHLTGR